MVLFCLSVRIPLDCLNSNTSSRPQRQWFSVYHKYLLLCMIGVVIGVSETSAMASPRVRTVCGLNIARLRGFDDESSNGWWGGPKRPPPRLRTPKFAESGGLLGAPLLEVLTRLERCQIPAILLNNDPTLRRCCGNGTGGERAVSMGGRPVCRIDPRGAALIGTAREPVVGYLVLLVCSHGSSNASGSGLAAPRPVPGAFGNR